MLDFSEALQIAEALIKIRSITPEDRGCQTLIKEILMPLGFQCEDIPHKEAHNLWATYGRGSPVVVLAGHTDVVSADPETDWDFPPFAANTEDGYLHGRGALDMKGALAAQITAAKIFIQQHPDFQGTLAFLITSAEEGPSHMGTPIVLKHLQTIGQNLDYCLIGEPSSDTQVGDTLRVGRRGSLHGRLTLHGKAGHVAYPHLADNPIHKLGPFIHDWTQIEWEHPPEDFPATTLQITDLSTGNTMHNVIPAKVTLRFNLRFSPAITAEEIETKTLQLLEKHGLRHELSWELSGEPFLTAPGKLLNCCDKVIQHLRHIIPKRSTAGGTSDGRFIAKQCPEVVELGLCHRGIHESNECVRITDLYDLSEIYYGILKELLL